MVIFALILLGFLAMGFLVYRDAKRTGASHPLLWGGLTVMSGIGGVILYILLEKFDLLSRYSSS